MRWSDWGWPACLHAVLWSAEDKNSALTVAYTRISCIVLGVLLLALLSVLINPAIASEQACPAALLAACSPELSSPAVGRTSEKHLPYVEMKRAGMGSSSMRCAAAEWGEACSSAARMLQVVGSLRSALVDLDKLNRLVWEEVMHTCSQEALRATVSQRSLNRAAMREASARSLMADGSAPQEPSSAAASTPNGLSSTEQGGSSAGDVASKGVPNGAGGAQAGLLRQAAAEEEARAAADAELAAQDEARLASHGEAGGSGRAKPGKSGEWCLELGALCGHRPATASAVAPEVSAEEQVRT